MSQEIPKNIWIITEETPSGARDGGGDTGGLLGSEEESTERDRGAVRIPVEKLKQEMRDFLRVVGYIFSSAEQQQSDLELDELNLSVEINGEGRINLLGIGGKAGSKGAIQLKFKRKLKEGDG
ncbi:MAG: hypothetical protein AB4426_15580 [Xenococcaceae cyanobacterium]